MGLRAVAARLAAFDAPALIVLVATVSLTVGLTALVIAGVSGDNGWFERYFLGSGALVLAGLAAAEFCLALRVVRSLAPSEPLHRAWFLIAASAAFHSAGAVFSQILGVRSVVNPLTWFPEAHNALELNWRELGLTLGGPLRFLLLAFGLSGALQGYRRAGLIGKLTTIDIGILAALAVYVLREFADLALALAAGKQPSLAEILNWPVDPLLWLLLAQSLLIRRSVLRTGAGWVGRCWGAYAIGVFLTVAGDAGYYLANVGVLEWPWTAVTWYLWLPAFASFALGPAYQWEAIRHAQEASRPRPAPGNSLA